MSNKLTSQPNSTQPMIYQIKLKGHLDRQWANWFEGLAITLEEDGNTLLAGAVTDQAELHGLLKKVRDLGMPLVSVNQIQNHSKKEIEMNTQKSTVGIDPRLKLSLLWIFVIVNMAYADILSLLDPTSPIREAMAGAPLPAGGLIAGAILMETSIAMIILPWILNYKVNRWVNIVIGALNILAIATGGHGSYYAFFATVEIACILLIIWFSWKWISPEAKPE
jgi:hypothetical protein